MKNMRLVLLAGQSNMAGRGIPGDDDLQEIPGLYALNASYQWVPAVEPVTFDKPHLAGVGCGRTFGRKLLELDPSTPVGLIPAAVGGTPIKSWVRGAKDPYSPHYPYDEMLEMVDVARRSGEIVAVLWHQGCGDAARKNANYADDLTAVIQNIRRDLNIENVPFICGELGKFLKDTPTYFPPVEEAIRQVTASLPNMALVSSEGLNDKGDKLHFDTPSQHIFGERYFEAFCRLTGIK